MVMRVRRVASLVAALPVAATLIVAPVVAEAQPAARPAAAPPAAPRPAPIDRNGVLTLIRTTLLALDAANKTGNYTVLRDLASPAFSTNSAADLAEIFARQRKDGLDLSAVAVLDPQLTVLPQIEPNGLMRMAGFFPSVDRQVNFELAYAPVNGQWRLFGLSVALDSSAPVAPDAPVATPAQGTPAPQAATPPKAAPAAAPSAATPPKTPAPAPR